MEINLNSALLSFRSNLKRNLLILIGGLVLVGGIFFNQQIGELFHLLGTGAQQSDRNIEVGAVPNAWQSEGLIQSKENVDQAALDSGKVKIDFQAAAK
jgi:hypothetical protein